MTEPSRGVLRVARTLAWTLAAGGLSTGAHLTAGGGLPSTGGIVLVVGLLVWSGLLLTRWRLGRVALAATLGGAQVVLHTLLSAGHHAPTCAVGGGHHEMVVGCVGGAEVSHTSPAMVLAHTVAALLLVWLAVSAALRPLGRLSEAVQERAPDDLRPLPLVSVQRELRPLVVALNGFTERLRGQFERQARFIADASHELRTPLAALKARIELGLRDADPAAWRSTLEDAGQSTDKVIHLANQLLSLARIESGAQSIAEGGAQRLDLSQLARELGLAMAALAHKRGVALALDNAHAYWAAAFAVLVVHTGGTRSVQFHRAFQRTVGTAAGLLVFALLLRLDPTHWWIIAIIVGLQFVVELLITRNYALAVVFLTPLALLISESVTGMDPDTIVFDRAVDTLIGVGAAVLVLVVSSRLGRPELLLRAHARRVVLALDDVLADLDERSRRLLRGLLVTGRGIPRSHCAVLVDGAEVGEVTSGTFSPTLKQGIALALLERSVAEGDEVVIDVRGREVAATVTKPPFVEVQVKS